MRAGAGCCTNYYLLTSTRASHCLPARSSRRARPCQSESVCVWLCVCVCYRSMHVGATATTPWPVQGPRIVCQHKAADGHVLAKVRVCVCVWLCVCVCYRSMHVGATATTPSPVQGPRSACQHEAANRRVLAKVRVCVCLAVYMSML